MTILVAFGFLKLWGRLYQGGALNRDITVNETRKKKMYTSLESITYRNHLKHSGKKVESVRWVRESRIVAMKPAECLCSLVRIHRSARVKHRGQVLQKQVRGGSSERVASCKKQPKGLSRCHTKRNLKDGRVTRASFFWYDKDYYYLNLQSGFSTMHLRYVKQLTIKEVQNAL